MKPVKIALECLLSLCNLVEIDLSKFGDVALAAFRKHQFQDNYFRRYLFALFSEAGNDRTTDTLRSDFADQMRGATLGYYSHIKARAMA